MSSTPPTATVAGDLADSIPDEKSCELLGPTALVVQALLGVFVILSLVYKRNREPRKRPWKIWLFDVSKQVVGQMFVHGANVLLSDLVSQLTSANACVFYFLHILMDTTIGVGVLYLVLRGLTYAFSEKLHMKGFESGVYGDPPAFNIWMRQATLYVMSLTTMKIFVITLFLMFPGLFSFGEWLLSWTRVGKGDSLQVIFAMGIFPIIMNVIQFWVIDSIVKASGGQSVALYSSTTDLHNTQDREPLFNAPDDEDDENVRPGDIETGRFRPPPSFSDESVHDKRSFNSGSQDENKSYAGSSPEGPVDHSYPPSLASSASSNQIPPKQAKNLIKKVKRTAPAPLTIRNQNSPAVNYHSPGVTPGQAALPHVPLVPLPAIATAPKDPPLEVSGDSWADSWDDSDDWANRVGEEDWTGRRIERTKDSLHDAWADNSTIRVGS